MQLNQTEAGLTALREEVRQTLLGAAKAAPADRSATARMAAMKALTSSEWQAAAKAVLMANRTSILAALSIPSLEAVADGHLDVHAELRRAAEIAIEHEAEVQIRDIAAKRWNLDLDEPDMVLHSLETGLLHDALMDAFISGQNTRST